MTCRSTRALLARGPLAEPQERQDRLAGVALEDVDGLEAVPAGMHVEQGKLLAAVHEVVGVVDVEHDRVGRARVAAAEEVDVTDADPVQRARVGQVLQARDRRLAWQAVATLRLAIAGDHQGRIEAQGVKIVAILIAGRDRHHARGHHGAVAVRDEERVALVGQRVGNHRGHLGAQRALAQQDEAAVGGEIARIPRGCERLAPER
jgi:hypothetical protein